MSERAIVDPRRTRSVVAGGLVVFNLFLLVMNLDKQGALPVSTGVFGSEQAVDGERLE